MDALSGLRRDQSKDLARSASHIVRENESLRRDRSDVLPPGFIAIADNGGGDLLVLGAKSEGVLVRDHETGQMSAVNVRWA